MTHDPVHLNKYSKLSKPKTKNAKDKLSYICFIELAHSSFDNTEEQSLLLQQTETKLRTYKLNKSSFVLCLQVEKDLSSFIQCHIFSLNRYRRTLWKGKGLSPVVNPITDFVRLQLIFQGPNVVTQCCFMPSSPSMRQAPVTSRGLNLFCLDITCAMFDIHLQESWRVFLLNICWSGWEVGKQVSTRVRSLAPILVSQFVKLFTWHFQYLLFMFHLLNFGRVLWLP